MMNPAVQDPRINAGPKDVPVDLHVAIGLPAKAAVSMGEAEATDLGHRGLRRMDRMVR